MKKIYILILLCVCITLMACSQEKETFDITVSESSDLLKLVDYNQGYKSACTLEGLRKKVTLKIEIDQYQMGKFVKQIASYNHKLIDQKSFPIHFMIEKDTLTTNMPLKDSEDLDIKTYKVTGSTSSKFIPIFPSNIGNYDETITLITLFQPNFDLIIPEDKDMSMEELLATSPNVIKINCHILTDTF